MKINDSHSFFANKTTYLVSTSNEINNTSNQPSARNRTTDQKQFTQSDRPSTSLYDLSQSVLTQVKQCTSTDRLESLKKQIQSNTYSISSETIAQKILDGGATI